MATLNAQNMYNTMSQSLTQSGAQPTQNAAVSAAPVSPTNAASPGLIGGARKITAGNVFGTANPSPSPAVPAAPQPAAGESSFQYKTYNGQQVRTDPGYMAELENGAKMMNMTPMQYDQMSNPSTWQARWGSSTGGGGGVIGGARGTSVDSQAPFSFQGRGGASGYAASNLGTPHQWNVDKDQTVEGRINGLTDPNNPLIAQARARALEQMNDHGLKNSSIAETAADAAAYQAALPIAQADAATAAKAAGYNADQTNQFSAFNAQAQNASKQFGATANNQWATSNLDVQSRLYSQNQDSLNKLQLANMDSATKLHLADVEAQYKVLMQSNASASDLFRQITDNITKISSSSDMNAAAKQAAIDNQLSLLKNGMSINGKISNLNLGDLLDFSAPAGTPTGSPTGTPAPAGAPAPGQTTPAMTPSQQLEMQQQYGGGGSGNDTNSYYRI